MVRSVLSVTQGEILLLCSGYEREMGHFTLAPAFTDEEQVRREEERECSKEREQMH
jgi:hypothetical protein